MLNLDVITTFSIEKPPLRTNISYNFVYVRKEQSLENILAELIEEVKLQGKDIARCIIFCQTRKQCSRVYRMFQVALGSNIFLNGSSNYEESLIHMFHAGSPPSVKTHAVSEMTKTDSCLRILICTIAFGMGIDCKGVYRSIHFGPSHSIDNLVQETGRLGRDGNQCFCYILYNGLLMAHCDAEIKELVATEGCRTRFITQLYPTNDTSFLQKGCLCCDWCSKKCTCIDHESFNHMSFQKELLVCEKKCVPQKRFVTNDQQNQLKKKLLQYRDSLLPSSTAEFIPVGSTGIFFEFGHYQIAQVLQNCDHLFTIVDIVDCVEIWRNVHANNIFSAMSEVFDDMDASNFPLLLSEENFQDMEVIDDDWEILRDDPSRGELFDNSNFEPSILSMMTEENSQYDDSLIGCEPDNLSGILAPITGVIENMEI